MRADRFRPIRAGIIGLYQYADQVFSFEEGRLALRGRNTSGKSKVLELVVPFVLEGDISPRKLDPFAKDARDMHWNLIGATDKYPEARSDQRFGYAWLEFYRPDCDVWVTAIVGLKANRADPKEVKRCYLVTGQRVGHDLVLCEHAADRATPVGLDTATTRVAEGGGSHVDTQTEYKRLLRERLIPFESAEMYDEMLRLIRQLRQPKLSKELKADTVSEMLNGTLPGVDEAQVRRMSDNLERLEELRRKRQALQSARRLATSLDEHAYRSYARAAVAHRAALLREAEQAFETASTALSRHEAEVEEAKEAAHEAGQALRDAEHASTLVRARFERLIGSPEVRAASEIITLRQGVDEADAAGREAEQETGRAEQARGRAAETVAAEARAAAAITEALRVLDGKLVVACTEAGLPAEDLTLVEGATRQRRQLVAEQRRRISRRDGAERDLLRAQTAEAQARREHAARVEEAERAEQRLQDARQQLRETTAAWLAGLTVLAPDSGGAQALADDPEGERHRVDGWWQTAVGEVADERACLAVRREELQRRDALAEAEIAALAADVQPGPPPRQPGRADRDGRPGAPLWRLVDFVPGLDDRERAGLEAALAEAGLLDAWVHPDGHIAEQDLSLVAGDPVTPSLADLLVVDEAAEEVAHDRVAALLAAVALDGPLSVAPGRFQAGVLHGRASKTTADFVGAAARQAFRERRLAQLHAEREELAAALAETAAADGALAGRRGRADAEKAALPGTDDIDRADRAHTRALQAVDLADRDVAAAAGRCREAEDDLSAAQRASEEHAELNALPQRQSALSAVEASLETVRDLAGNRQIELARADERAKAVTAARQALDDQDETLVRAQGRQQRTSKLLATAQGALQAAEMALGRSAEEVQQQVAAEREEVARVAGELKKAQDTHVIAREALAGLRAQGGELTVRRDSAEQTRQQAVAGVRALGVQRFFTAAAPDGEPLIPDEADAGSWTLTLALERIRSRSVAEIASAPVDARRLEQLANAVNARVDDLALELSSHGMQASIRHDDGLLVCEVAWLGSPRTLRRLVRDIAEELGRHTRLLNEETSRVLGESVLSELAEHLRASIARVKRSLGARNAALRKCPTGGGKTLELEWDVAPLEDHDAAAVRLLERRSVGAMPDPEREQVFAFIQRCLHEATEMLGADNDEQRRRGVADALDYRRWYVFELFVRELDGSRAKLTGRKHGEGSGGEQSTLMNVALFASAAAMYDLVPEAPRLIALDEAMDGIDEGVRRKVLGALVDLELDFVATSFDLDPCVQEVPAVGFYELHRENAVWGVFAQHFIWRGGEKVEVIDEDEIAVP